MKPKPLHQIKKELQQTASTTRNYLHHRLRIQGLKGLVIFLLYTYLWDSHMLIKWSLLLVLPIGFFYIMKVMLTKNRLEDKLSNLMEEIDRMDR